MQSSNLALLSDRLRRLSFQYPGPPTDPLPNAISDDRSESSGSHVLGSAAADIDIDFINRSLDHVNNFAKRRNTDKLPPVLMYEINSTGESMYKSMTLRELLNYVNDEANELDDAAMMEAIMAHNRKLEEQDRQNHDKEKNSNSKSAEASKATTAAAGAKTSENRAPSPATLRRAPSPVSLMEGRRLAGAGAQNLAQSKPIYESRYNLAANLPTSNSSGNLASAQQEVNLADASPEETYDATGGLRLRDLRRLDFQFNPNEERSVLIRRHAVLFAMVSISDVWQLTLK